MKRKFLTKFKLLINNYLKIFPGIAEKAMYICSKTIVKRYDAPFKH